MAKVKINSKKFDGGHIPVNVNGIEYNVKNGDDVPDEVFDVLKDAGYIDETPNTEETETPKGKKTHKEEK